MASLRALISATGLAGLLVGATASASRTTPVCEEQDTYLVTRQTPTQDFVGKGYVCENKEQYYGWLEPLDSSVTLSELLRAESSHSRDSIHYRAGRLAANQETFEKEYTIPARLDTNSVRTRFKRGWGLFSVTVDMHLRRREADWQMNAVAQTTFIRWFSIECAVREDLYFSCPK